MHYIAYLDEFGHIGPFISRTHENHKTSPVFGLGGIILPVDQVREFAIYFYQLKGRLLAFELTNPEYNPRQLPAYQWEKKGATLYTTRNMETYPELRKATGRLFNHIQKIGGYAFFAGEKKSGTPEQHDSATLFQRTLLQAVRRIDKFCTERDSTFMLVLDHQEAGDKWREGNVETCTLAMFEHDEKARTLIEPPIQAESHLYQTLQCADWICGLVGRLQAYSVAAEEYSDWEIFEKFLGARLRKIATPCSALEPPGGEDPIIPLAEIPPVPTKD